MNKIYTLLLFLSVSIGAFSQGSSETEYTNGVFFVNEDWYGHQNSTINFLSDEGEWTYGIFQKSNPGKELGCTSQFGTIYGNKFYIVSKQERDPGASVTGSRFAVCDAKTMVCLKEFQTIATDEQGKSIADGRSFVGVNEKKGYIGTSNGIWVYNIENMTIGNQIEGTGNPNSSGYGQLYYAQIGTMVRTEDYVFAIHQQYGLIIIDPETDKVIKIIAAPEYDNNGTITQSGFGSIVQSKDGNLWISMAANVKGMGATLPYVLRMNPYTFEADTIQIPNDAGIEDIPNSWYAWTADGFCASTQKNKIYWSGNNGNSWFKGRRIFCYDIDKEEFVKIFDFEEMEGNWILYGAGFRLHPVIDEIYCSLFHEFQDPTYETVRISNQGELLQEYSMITNYWFPAIPVFPDNNEPVISDISDIYCNKNSSYTLALNDYVTDKDNMNVSIVKSIMKNTATQIFEATISNGNLTIQAVKNKEAIGYVIVRFNSNGKIADKKIRVIIGAGGEEFKDVVGIEDVIVNISKIYFSENTLFTEDCQGYQISIYNINGTIVESLHITNDRYQKSLNLPKGIYILHGKREADSITKKIISK